MSKPVFKNEREFAVSVGTPSGAGRIVNPGEAVEGDYFFSSVRAGMPLRQLSEEEVLKFNKRYIIMSVSLNEGATIQEAGIPHKVVPVPQEVKQVFSPGAIHETPFNKTMEESLAQAHKEMGTAIPTWNELNKMSADQLKDLANRYNISSVGTRSDLLRLLKARLVA